MSEDGESEGEMKKFMDAYSVISLLTPEERKMERWKMKKGG